MSDRPHKKPLRNDLLVVGALAFGLYLLALYADIGDRCIQFLKDAEAIEIDELVIVGLALVPALLVVLWRESARTAVAEQLKLKVELAESADTSLQAEVEQRQTAEVALRKSVYEDHLHLQEIHTIYETAPVGLCSVDRDLRFVRINQKLAEINGLPEASHIGRTLSEVLPPALADTVVPVYRRVLETGRPVVDVEISGRTACHPDADRTWLVSYYPLVDSDGVPSGVNGVVVDVTERKRAERDAMRVELELERLQKVESLDVLVGGIAHDFNNLLMVIGGNLELSLCGALPKDTAHFLGEAQKAVGRASAICRELLTYTGRSKPVLEPFDLGDVTRSVARMLRSTTGKRVGLAVRGGDAGRYVVEGDESQITQVLMNLVINASHAIGDRDGQITLTVADGPNERTVKLTCADTGCGMDAATAARAFEPFFTSKTNGRGLGLAAAKGIVSRHKGSITIDSKVGVGTTFTLLLPLAKAVRATDIVPVPAGRSVPSQVFLIVDDDPSVRRITALGLERRGASVLQAEDGETACRLMADRPANLSGCLIDFHMPGMNGAETYKRLRASLPAVPMILISGNLVAEAEDAVRTDPRAGTLQKPYSVSKAIDLLDALGVAAVTV